MIYSHNASLNNPMESVIKLLFNRLLSIVELKKNANYIIRLIVQILHASL